MANYANLLIITHESVGEKMAGPGIRYWEISRALGTQGTKVTLATPLPSQRSAPGVTIENFIWEDLHALIRLIQAHDVVLSNGPVLARLVHLLGHPIEKPIIVDVYYSPEIEQMMLNLTMNREFSILDNAAFDDLHTYLRQGDFFICATEKQIDLWTGALMAAGRLNTATLGIDYTLEHLLKLVPMGFPELPPTQGPPMIKGVVPGIGRGDKVIYWGGGIWDWTDPLTLLEALKIVLREREDVRLVFGALHHYEKSIVPEMSVAGRLVDYVEKEGWLNRHVFFLDWVPYDSRGSYLREVDIGVSLTLKTIENRYAVRARLMDYLWAALPCVANEGDDIAEILRHVGLARLVAPRDVTSVAGSILTILQDEDLRSRCEEQVNQMKTDLSWNAVVKPILEYLENPARARDADQARAVLRNQIPLRKEWETLRQDNEALRYQIEMFHQRRSVRFFDSINKFVGRS